MKKLKLEEAVEAEVEVEVVGNAVGFAVEAVGCLVGDSVGLVDTGDSEAIG